MQRVVLMMTLTAVVLQGGACSYPKEKFRELQQEVARQAAEPKTPEERCQRQGGVIHNDQCYLPSTAAIDGQSCRLRGGLYLDSQCLLSSQTR
jgi:hypothetical protein